MGIFAEIWIVPERDFSPHGITHVASRNNEEFKAEFNNVVDALRFDERFGGLLKNRSSLAEYCYANPDSGFEGSYSQEFGFRADTEKYYNMLRCNPNKGDYNFYIYAYERKWLDNHLTNATKGIRFIDPHYKDKFRIPDGNDLYNAGRLSDSRPDYSQEPETVEVWNAAAQLSPETPGRDLHRDAAVGQAEQPPHGDRPTGNRLIC